MAFSPFLTDSGPHLSWSFRQFNYESVDLAFFECTMVQLKSNVFQGHFSHYPIVRQFGGHF